MLKSSGLVPCLVTTAALLACNADAPQSATEATGSWGAGEAWSLREEWRIGGAGAAETEAFSGQRMDVALGPNGQVFVLDPQPGEIRVFDRAGEYVRTIGRRGRGPGEFGFPLSIAFSPDSHLWVRDAQGSYAVFDSVGTLLSSFERPRGSLNLPLGAGVFDHLGRFVDEGGWWFPDGRRGVVLFRVAADGSVVDSLPAIEAPQFLRMTTPPPQGGPQMEAAVSPGLAQLFQAFAPRLEFTIGTDNTIWTAESNAYRLIQRSQSGDTLRVVDGPNRPYTLEAEDQRRISETLSSDGLPPEMYAFSRQIIQGMISLPDGHLVVGIEEIVGAPTETLDVFSPAGSFLGSIQLPFSVRLNEIDVRSDTLVAISRDDLDAPFIVRALLERP